MSFFSQRKAGLTRYELDKEHIRTRMKAVLTGSHAERDRKMAALSVALEQALDRDVGAARGAVEPGEFDAILAGLVDGHLITADESTHLRAVAADALRD